MKFLLQVLCICVLAPSVPVYAQNNQLALEATSWRGTLSFARSSTPAWFVGLEAGLGVSGIDQTIIPQDEDFTEPYTRVQFCATAPRNTRA